MAMGVLFLLLSDPALCQEVGQPCSKLGQTIVSEDRKTIISCLSAGMDSSATALRLIWMVSEVPPLGESADKNDDGDPFGSDAASKKQK
jgi:hypothetical protein